MDAGTIRAHNAQMNVRKLGVAIVATATLLISCSEDQDACDELDQLTQSGDSDALAADAVDPDGVFMACVEHMGDTWDDMSQEERDAFLSR